MRKDVAIKLQEKAGEIARKFSNPNREKNLTGETFEVEEIRPLSDTTAAIILKKNTGKRVLAFCYWINSSGGYWNYFFSTDSHVLGMDYLKPILKWVEEKNFPHNFKGHNG